ncbi:uncharacterized protein LOC117628908 [Prunus dulcis]|uniref:uncharacterized protein LOC117628908 n=1 Tax=Prunus dulcis TaxID=3755 RepID=UPI001482B41A|nr:uncharacterized protein LOC117628908 [Prunus dulcis]
MGTTSGLGLQSTAESDSEYVPSNIDEPTYRSATPTRYSEARLTDRLYSADDLYTIRQREDEPLGEYAARFSHEYSRCPKTDDKAAYGAFKSGLWSSHFQYLMHHSNWGTYDELIKQAAIHAKAEYFNSKSGPSARQEEPALKSYPGQESPYAPRRAGESSARHKQKDDRDTRQGHSKKEKGKYDRNDHRAPLPNYDHGQEVFNMLNTTYEAILMNENEIIPKPNHQKPNRQDNQHTGKFCRYHQHNSHNTEECIRLRKIIECLIREGKLDQYIARSPQAPVLNQNSHINMISTISGGPTLAGWEPITFCEDDEEGIIYPHDDPMIIRAEIADYDIGRVLIDTGSSVNVIFADTFRGMGIADS